MSVVFDHRDPGTPEQEWEAARLWARARPLSLGVDRLVVLAAHPDDETLGAGGLLAEAAAAGVDASVIVATDGEASHEAAPGEPAANTLGLRRRLEVVAALAEMAPRARIRFLGLPDGGLRENAAALETALREELGELPHGVLLAAPWWGDGHRDHRIAGEAALAMRSPGVRVIGYPIWLWHWGRPAELDALVGAEEWRMLPLSAPARAAKATALSRHESQVSALPGAVDDAPIVHEGMTAHFGRSYELFVDADGAGPHDSTARTVFDDHFRTHDDPWGFESRWYEQRKREVLMSALPRRRYASALELGCANGVLTARLAERADTTCGVDISPVALERARERLADYDGVRLRRHALPRDWPDGEFDLIVLSETGFYFSTDDLATAIARIDTSLSDDGVLVACHWRHAISDAPLTGDDVHAALGRAAGWNRTVRHLETDFVLEVFERASPDRETGA